MPLAKTLVLGSALFLAFAANAEEATILTQQNAPLEITSYTNRYQSPDRVGDGTVAHRTMVKNTSDQVVEAYGIGLYIFDSFKRELGRPFIGYAMNPIEPRMFDQPGWEQRPNSAFLFQGHGHGLAYIAIARMEDGSVWRANTADITRQLEDFEFQLTKEKD